MSASTDTRWAVQNGMFTFACPSPAAWFPAALDYTLAGVAQQIRCPTLVIDTEAEWAFKGQARTLYDAHLPKAFLMFTTEEGAEDHCQAGSPLLSAQRTFDWLQETSAVHPPRAPHRPPRQATSATGARRHVPGQRSKTTRSCRISDVAPTHVYAPAGIFTHGLGRQACFLDHHRAVFPILPVGKSDRRIRAAGSLNARDRRQRANQPFRCATRGSASTCERVVGWGQQQSG